MKPLSYLALVSTVLSVLAMSSLLHPWTITKDYQIRFSSTGAVGTFHGLEGTIQFSPRKLSESRMDVRVAVATIDTGNKTKDRHARGESWLAAGQYPYIRFVSSEFRQSGTGYVVDGQLTLRGLTRRVSIPFRFERHGAAGVFAGEFTVQRQDYGIEGPWLAALTVGDEIAVQLRVPVSSQ